MGADRNGISAAGRPRFSRRRWQAFGKGQPQSEIFEHLRSAGRNAAETAELIDELLRRWPEDQGIREEITRREHEGDRLTHKVINNLRVSKLTPYDREDIYALAGAIDDIVDDVEEVSEQLALREVEAPMEQAQQLAGVLGQSARSLSQALDGLETLDGIEDHLADVRRLEQQGDQIYRGALASLFDGAIDPMFVIRWKDIYEALEEAIDRCRAAGNSLESMIVKHT